MLCQRFLLFPRLCVAACCLKLYPVLAGSALITPSVDIFNDAGFQQRPAVSVDVITAAGRRFSCKDDAMHHEGRIDELSLTWGAVLLAASEAGTEVLILSALGAGAFCIPPEMVTCALSRAPRWFAWSSSAAGRAAS